MTELILYLKNNLAEHFVIYFIPLYYLGGRPIALISAQLLGHKISFLMPVAVMLDTLQIPLFYHLSGSISKSTFIRKLAAKGQRKEATKKGTRLFQWVQTLGTPGVVIIALLPLKGCGILSGFILSRLLKIPKPVTYPLLILGSLLGCLILFGLGEMILEGWEVIKKIV
jgi:uncharacterized membrane protein